MSIFLYQAIAHGLGPPGALKIGRKEPGSKTGLSVPLVPGAWECRTPVCDPGSGRTKHLSAGSIGVRVLSSWGCCHKLSKLGDLNNRRLFSQFGGQTPNISIPGPKSQYLHGLAGSESSFGQSIHCLLWL